MERFVIRVAGTSFRQNDVAASAIGTECQLVPDPTNKYDKNAIKVICSGRHLGFVPKEQNVVVLEAITQQVPFQAKIASIGRAQPEAPLGVLLEVDFEL